MAQNIGQTVAETVKQSVAGTLKEALGAGIPAPLEPGVIANQGLLDLTSARTPEDLRHIKALYNVGLVLVPEALAAELNKIPMTNVGATLSIPQGGRLRLFNGQTKLAGDTFVGEECKDDVVVLAGQTIFTSPVEPFHTRELVVGGQLLAPQKSQKALGAAITRLSGQVIYYPGEAPPRVLLGNQDFEDAFFRAMRQPEVLVLIGNYNFADDVKAESLQSKLAGLVVIGNVTSSAALKPVLQALCTECVGQIKAR